MKRIFILLTFLGLSLSLFSQPCTGLAGTQNGPAIVFGDPGNLTTTVNGIAAGDFVLVYVCAGTTYTFSTCGTALGDSEISVLDDMGNTITDMATDYIDANSCGDHETLTWVAPVAYAAGGYVQVVVSQNGGALGGGPCQGGALQPTADLTITSDTPCSPTGADCLNPYIAGFPVNETGLTTCNFGSAYTTSSCGDDNYLEGEDFVISFTVPGGSAGCYDVALANTGTFTGVQILDGCPDAGGTCIGSANSAGGTNPTLQVTLAAGNYFMIVSTFPDPPCTDFDVTMTACPPGMTCADPYILSGFPVSETGLTTCGFGDNYTTSNCGEDNYLGGEDFVISYTPPSTGCYEISLTNTLDYVGITVLDGCPDAGGGCIGFEGSAATNPTLNVELTGSTPYFIIIDTWPTPDCSDFDIAIGTCPAGTTCGNPIMIGALPYSENGSTTCGFGDEYDTTNAGGGDCSAGVNEFYLNGDDIVYTFSPPATGCYTMDLNPIQFAMGLFVFDDCLDSGGACVGASVSTDNGNAPTDIDVPALSLDLNVGTTYYFVISTDPSNIDYPTSMEQCGTFDFEVFECPPGSTCADPFIVPSTGSYTGLTTCGSGDDYDTANGCGDDDFIGGEDYVMQFTAPSSGCYTLDFTNTDNWLGVFINDACPPSAASCIGFGENQGADNVSTNVYLESGTTYYFTVSTFPNPQCSAFDFNIMECNEVGEDCSTPEMLTVNTTSSFSTCAMGDNYDDGDACMSTFMNGEDIVMDINIPSDGCYDIVVSNASDATANFGVFILDGCPDAGASCLGQGTASAGTPTVTANLTSGNYTIVVASSGCSDFDIIVSSVACPQGATCANPLMVNQGSNGPIDMAGSGDDYETTDACGGDYMGGNDFVMTFTPGATDCYTFSTSGTGNSNADADLGLFILDNCPDVLGTNCIASNEVDNDFPVTDAYLQQGQTYYVVVGAIENGVLGATPSTTEFNLDINPGGTNCPPGANCSNPAIVNEGSNGPFDACGAGNDYDDTAGCMNVYMDGEDFVMTFTPAVDDCYDFIVNGTANSDAAADVGLFVLDDCPSAFGVNCLVNETADNDFPMGSATLMGGQTYYIVVSAIDIGVLGYTPSCTEFELTINSGSLACPLGPDCDNPYVLPSLGSYPGLSSCGSGDDWDQTFAQSCTNGPDFYMEGEDMVMTFTPSTSGCHNFQFSNPTNPDADGGVFIFDGCPDNNPGCVAFSTQDGGLPDNVITDLVAGTEYYIIFSAIESQGTPIGTTFSSSCTGFDLDIVACNPPDPIQDCIGGIVVCENSYTYDDGFQGDGDINNEVGPGSCLSDGERNSVWFIVPVEEDGNLGFTISPDDLSDDYDFAAYDITSGGCEGITTGASPEVSCNYALSPGVTGANGTGTGDSQGADGTLFNSLIPVTAGQTIALMVSNFGTSSSGFTLDLNPSSIEFEDGAPPMITSVTDPVDCGATMFDVEFSETIRCNTFATCDFNVVFPDGSNHALTDVTAGSGCAAGNAFEQNFTFTVDAPMTQGGTYTLEVGNGCSGIEDNCGNVQMNTSITFEVMGITCTVDEQIDETCGNGMGSITVSASGGTSYTYSLDSGAPQSSGMFTGLSAGTYTIVATDVSGCTCESTVTLMDSGTPPTIDNIMTMDATCGNDDGEVTFEVNGGTAPYMATIGVTVMNGGSPFTFDGLAAGPYVIDIVDDNGCTATANFTINDGGAPTITNIDPTDATCGQADGSVEVTITGGTAPYTLDVGGTIVMGASPLTVSGLMANGYPIIVTDANGCSVNDNVTINDGGSPMLGTITPTNSTCGNADGSVEIVVTGGTSPYTVDLGGGNTAMGASPLTVTGLAADTYTITVTDDAGCTAEGSVTIMDAGGPMLGTITPTPSTCGQADGSVEVVITDGQVPYTLTVGGEAPVMGNSPLTVTGLAEGDYSITVEDANGCMVTGMVTITDSGSPTIGNIAVVDANCMMSNGSLTINVSGGMMPYSYDVNSNVQNGDNVFTGLPAGAYTIIVTDANGCSVTDNATINDIPGIVIDNVDVTDANCGQADGSITVTVSGGPAPITYNFDGNEQTDNGTFNGIAAGTYPLIVTDDNGCTATQDVTIDDLGGITLDGITIEDAACGMDDGTATINITGGTAPITYTLDGNDQIDNNVFTGLAEGSYPVMIVDAAGCTAEGTAVVGGSDAPVIDDIDTVDASCGQSDGEATINVSGGTAPYEYNLDGVGIQNDPMNTFTGLASGNYALTVTDANGCTVMETVNITDADGPMITDVSVTAATCDMATGEFTVTISGGAPPYNITANGTTQTDMTFTGLTPGDYPISVEDANGCISTATATIDNIPGVQIDDITTTEASCGQDDGSKTVVVSGGNAPYTFECNGIMQIDNGVFEGLSSGTYTVLVTDADGCTAEGSATITDADGPTIDNVAVGDADCGMPNGTLTVNANAMNGMMPFTYTVDGVEQTDNVFTGLLPGVYDPIIVTDANGCTATTTATIDDIAGVVIDEITTTDATCGQADGSKTIVVSGGTAPYTFSCNGVDQVDNGTFTGLMAGSYPVTVTDANGCTATGNASINDANGPSIDSAVATNADCGMSNGTITVTISGGATPYNVTVNNTTLQTSETIVFDNLPAGDYGIEVVDNSGCAASSSAEVLDTPGVIVDDVVITDASCGQADGSKEIMVSGGTPPYTFTCNNITQVDDGLFENLPAGMYPWTVEDANGCTASGTATINDANGPVIDDVTVVDASDDMTADGSITVTVSGGLAPYTVNLNSTDIMTNDMVTFNGLMAGTYPITVTDANGCMTSGTATVGGDAVPCPTIDNIIITDANCMQVDGGIEIIASGGTPPLMYSINGGTDFQASNMFNPLPAGNYDVVVTDAAGCEITDIASIQNIGGPTIDNTIVANVMCGNNDGSIEIIASGGTPPLMYLVNNMPSPDDNIFNNLSGGVYSITVIDGNACQATGSVEIIDDGTPVITDVMTVNASCGGMDGSLTITANGGLAPLEYSIDGGTTFQSNNVFDGISGGTYMPVVMDANGCTATNPAVTVDENGAPVIDDIVVTDATCGNDDGSIAVAVSGGVAPYTIEIDGTVMMGSGTITFTGLGSDTYIISIMDANGCNVGGSATINDLDGPVIDNISVMDATNGNADGSITVTASNGTPPYTFEINGQMIVDPSTATFTGLPAGNYPITVTDANGCITSGTATINEGECPTIDDITTTNAQCGQATGSITVTATGGVAPLMYQLDNGTATTNNVFMNVAAGTYMITVTDGAGCIVTEMVTVTEDGAPVIDDVVVTGSTCGDNNGTAVVTVSGGMMPYSYTINGIQQSENNFDGLQPDNYTVTVTDANGCQVMQPFTIEDLAAPVIDDVTTTNASCGMADGSVTIIASGGTGTLMYSFDGGAFTTDNVFNGVEAGGYDYAVMDDNCTVTGVIGVSNDGGPTITDVDVLDASCGNADGALTINTMGGTPPLTYTVNGIVQVGDPDFSGLAAGDYAVEVEDANMCIVSTVATITESGDIDLSILGDMTLCEDETTLLMAVPTTPNPNYSYEWSTGSLTSETAVSDEGIYMVTATLGNCTGTAATQVVEIMLDPQAGDDVALDCTTNTATLDGSNSTGVQITFEWTTPDGMIVGATDEETVDIEGPGMYILTISEPFGDCSEMDTVIVTQNAAIPTADAGSDMEINCLIQAVTLDGSGSDTGADFSYSWVGDGITAANVTQQSPQVTEPGEYILTVTNDNTGCMAMDTVVVTENVEMPIATIEVIIPIDCSNTTLEIDGSNSSSGPEFAYQWLDENMNPIAGEINSILTIDMAGTYTLQVTNITNGCVSSETVTVDDLTAFPLTVATVSGVLTCDVMEVNLDGTGSQEGATIVYEWVDAANNLVGNNLVEPVSEPGFYTLTVTDTDNDCFNEITVEVTQDIQQPIASAGPNTELDCLDPSIMLDGSNSSQGANITYLWTGDNGQTIGNPTSLTPSISETGVYTILVTNTENGCTETDEVTVDENMDAPTAIDVVLEIPTCAGDSDGAIFIENVQGGTGPYLYEINGGGFAAQPTFNALSAGDYEISVQSSNGCIYTETVPLNDGNDLMVDLGDDLFINLGESADFEAFVNIDPFDIDTIIWSSKDSLCPNCFEQAVLPMNTTNYDIQVVDENGCIATDDLTIFVNENVEVYMPNIFSPNNDGENDMFYVQSVEGVVQTVRSFQIFNRWGDLVFENNNFQPNDPSAGWDGVFQGKVMNPQVFVYMIEAEFINGNVETFSGDVTLAK